MPDSGPTLAHRSLAKTALIPAACLCAGVVSGILLANPHPDSNISDNCPVDLAFVKPEDDCASIDAAADRMQVLRDDLRRQIATYVETKRVSRASIFVRDLDSQKFAYVNETEEFYIASLLKVPLAIAYFRLAELTPDLLDQRIAYDGKVDASANQQIRPPVKLEAGSYTVEDLIRRALVYSDNNSAALLTSSFISYDYLQKILFTLGLQPNAKDQGQNLVSARTFAGVFRTLYNSSFLSREYSDEILAMLSQSSFAEGAPALIPKDVPVAHKFAERSFDDARGLPVHQLHDCGIVYGNAPSQAYSFCIMTEGRDFSNLKSVIQGLSKTIYDGIGR